jgi:threonine dehydratase
MSVVKLLGFGTLACGCVVGRYRDMASLREVIYVEEKGPQCASAAHRQNHTISALRNGRTADGFQPALAATRAS